MGSVLPVPGTKEVALAKEEWKESLKQEQSQEPGDSEEELSQRDDKRDQDQSQVQGDRDQSLSSAAGEQAHTRPWPPQAAACALAVSLLLQVGTVGSEQAVPVSLHGGTAED